MKRGCIYIKSYIYLHEERITPYNPPPSLLSWGSTPGLAEIKSNE